MSRIRAAQVWIIVFQYEGRMKIPLRVCWPLQETDTGPNRPLILFRSDFFSYALLSRQLWKDYNLDSCSNLIHTRYNVLVQIDLFLSWQVGWGVTCWRDSNIGCCEGYHDRLYQKPLIGVAELTGHIPPLSSSQHRSCTKVIQQSKSHNQTWIQTEMELDNPANQNQY